MHHASVLRIFLTLIPAWQSVTVEQPTKSEKRRPKWDSAGAYGGPVQRSEEREGPTGPNQTTTAVVWASGAGQGSKPSRLDWGRNTETTPGSAVQSPPRGEHATKTRLGSAMMTLLRQKRALSAAPG